MRLVEYQINVMNAIRHSPGVNLVSDVCASDTPFAPLGLAIEGINADYTPFASPRLSQAPLSSSGAEGVWLKSGLETRGMPKGIHTVDLLQQDVISLN